MSETVVDRNDAGSMAKAALAAAVLAVAGFVGLGFTAGGWWFLVGVAFGVIAVAAGVTARRRRLDPLDRRIALAGIIVGGLIVIWFVGYIVIAGIASLF